MEPLERKPTLLYSDSDIKYLIGFPMILS